ncbi:MAG TPA: hypothetical protein VFU02_19320 [Polyangiaceae bacterium]|nr:hypothetical protein [Polyangiaceae bacterium]
MSDSNDGSSGVPPESPDLDVDQSGLRERHAVPSSVKDGPARPAGGGAVAQLPRVPDGVMARATAQPTAGVGTSLVPSTEPSAELAARAHASQTNQTNQTNDAEAASAAGDADPASAAATGAGRAEPDAAPVSVTPPPRAPSEPVEAVTSVPSGESRESREFSESRESEPSVLQVLAPHLTEEQLAARRKDKLRGLVIIGGTFVACILLSVWGKEQAEPEESLPPRPPTTEGIAGWPNKVDPFAALPLARSISQRDLLRGIVAEHVDPEGTVDFEKGAGTVRYSFQSEPGHGPQPPRDPGRVPPRSYCGKQSVNIRRHGIVADPDVPAFPCQLKARDSLPNPECTTKQIWDYAITQGVPKGKPARIEYFSAQSGPAYRFTVPGTQHRVVVASDCKTELKSREAHGGVP